MDTTTTTKRRLSAMVIPSIAGIEQVVCKKYEIPVSSLNIRTRKRVIKEARQICMWWRCRNTKESLASIGARYTDRSGRPFDHATVLHAKKTVDNLKETDKEFRQTIEDIERQMAIMQNTTGKLKRIAHFLKENVVNLNTIETILDSVSEDDEEFNLMFWNLYYEIFSKTEQMSNLVKEQEDKKENELAA